MKHRLFFSYLLPIIGMSLFICNCGTKVSAQTTTSYSANTVPIGGTNSVGVGVGALTSNTGSSNTAVGYQALNFNTGGSSNSAFGFQALYNTRTVSGEPGFVNTAVGANSMYANTKGFNNTAVGANSMASVTVARYNTAVGTSSMGGSTGSYNTSVGAASLANSSGWYNTAIGWNAMTDNLTGERNVALGGEALDHNLSGYRNVSVGYNSMYFNETGNSNTAIGHYTIHKNKDGSGNIAIGDSAGINNLGNGNIYIGNRIGFEETGNNKLYIGNDSNKTIIYGDMSTGRVLLGKKQPHSYSFAGNRTLYVIGGILTDSIRVAPTSSWSDYVFDVNYDLRPLPELEQFIKTNKRLPNIPSATEVEKNGINLFEMNAKLLEKVEELTLYILKQQKQIDAQQNDSQLIKKKFEEQQQQIDELKKLLLKVE
jgi:trimeric autotransporter adhesin